MAGSLRLVIYLAAIGIASLGGAMALSLEAASAATACPGAHSPPQFLLSSCSGAPGTHLTLTGPAPAQLQHVTFSRIAGGNEGEFAFSTPLVGAYTAGAYILTVPQTICSSGSHSFFLTVYYLSGNFNVLSQNLGTFTAICTQTAQATASPKPTSAPTQAAASTNCVGGSVYFKLQYCNVRPGLAAYVVQLKQFNISNVGAFHPTQVRLYAYSATGSRLNAGTLNVTAAPSVGTNVYAFTVPVTVCYKGGKISVGIYMISGNNALAWGNAGVLSVGC